MIEFTRCINIFGHSGIDRTMKSKSVLTYSFGENTDPLRDPLVIDEDTEYICVTDNRELKSNVWNFVYQDFPNIKSNRDKVVLVKFNPFRFINTESVCVIDSTLEIKKSLKGLFELLNESDLIFKKHPMRNSLGEELPIWFSRGLTNESFYKFLGLAFFDRIDLYSVFEFEGCLFLLNKTLDAVSLMAKVIAYSKYLGSDGNFIPTNQCPLSYVIDKFYRDKVAVIDVDIQQNYFNRYNHTGEINLT